MNLNFAPLLLVLAFVILNEAAVEYLFGSVKLLKPYLPLLSLATAIFLTFIYAISFFSLMGIDNNTPFLDFLFTGFIISRLSNYVNDFVQKLLGSK